MAKMESVCPLFPSADIPRSLKFYSEQLNFRVALDIPNYGIVTRDEIEIHFWPCEDRNISENTSAYFRTSDIEALHADLAQTITDARITDVENRDWGMREFYIWDPDGNLLRFGQEIVT